MQLYCVKYINCVSCVLFVPGEPHTKLQTISASDLARNTSAILDRILSGEAVSVMRNSTEIAHIVPAKRTMAAAQAIAGLAGKLTPAQGDSWLRDSRGEFDQEIKNPWE
jgi:antitoxin (DNA-binding transcriptional repressor) of toxin-antitoxin stability system